MANYYIRNQYTGESATREFVERFVTNWASPDECERSLYDSIYGITHGGMQDTYMVRSAAIGASIEGNRHNAPQTIGRASRLSDGRNVNEVLWCMKIDVSRACKRLNKKQRNILALRYIYDYADETIADIYGVQRQHVSRMVKNAFDALAKYLDDGNLR